jgi:hypothetical protein
VTFGMMTGSVRRLASTWDDATTFHLTGGQVDSQAPALIPASSNDPKVRTGGRAYRTCQR